MWTGWVQRRSSTELGWELLLHNEAICFLMGCSTTLKGRKDGLFIQQAGTQAFRLASLATEDSKVSDWEIWLWRQTSLICNLAGPIVLKLQHIYHGGSSHRTALLTESWFLPAWYLLHTGHHEVQVRWQMWACSVCTGSLWIWFVFFGRSGDQSQQGREERSEEGLSWL